MKKIFGIFLVIIGIICLPKVFTPSVYETIGGLIGISVVSFLPAYFLLREKKKELETQTNHDKQTSNVNQASGISTIKKNTQGDGQCSMASPTEENYVNLFEELKAKCHPKQFMEPYDHKKVKMANELYARILDSKDDMKRLEEFRAEAMDKLEVKFSTKRFYEKLIKMTNPANFMNPYDAEKVAVANDYYQKVQQNRGNIVELESIWKEVNDNSVFSSFYSDELLSLRGDKAEDIIEGPEISTIVFIVLSIIVLFLSFLVWNSK